jgi:hypothetical protein
MPSIRLVVATASLLGMSMAFLPMGRAFAESGGAGSGSLGCEPEQQWDGTQTSVQVLQVSGAVSYVPCPQPQVNDQAGGTTYTTSFTPPPDGSPCHEQIWSDVWMGDLRAGHWTVRYYDPNAHGGSGDVVSATVPDNPDYFPIGSITNSLGDAAELMGSDELKVPWAMRGTYEGGVCRPNSQGWITAAGSCNPWDSSFAVQDCFVFPFPRGNLTYTPPASATFTPYLQNVAANMRATYHTGLVTTTWADGGQSTISPGIGQAIVRYPECYAETGGNLGAPHYWEVLIPQPNTGPALVVDYVVSASVDETWWDFGDGQYQVVAGGGSEPNCFVESTYFHVSADIYGSENDHTNPPGETWSFGSEPHKDMEAVEAWHHVAVTVTAYWREPDGSTRQQSIPVPPGTDFWLADTPEWQTVGQFESIPFEPSPSG